MDENSEKDTITTALPSKAQLDSLGIAQQIQVWFFMVLFIFSLLFNIRAWSILRRLRAKTEKSPNENKDRYNSNNYASSPAQSHTPVGFSHKKTNEERIAKRAENMHSIKESKSLFAWIMCREKKKKCPKLQAPEICLTLSTTACVLRIVWSFDPQEHYCYPFCLYGTITRQLLMIIPQEMIIGASILLFLVWRGTIMKSKALAKSFNFKTVIKTTVILIFILTIIILPLSIIYALGIGGKLIRNIHNGILGIFVISLMFLSVMYNKKLATLIKDLSTDDKIFKVMTKFRHLMIALTIVAGVLVVAISWNLFDQDTALKYHIFWWILHLCESVCLFIIPEAVLPPRNAKIHGTTNIGMSNKRTEQERSHFSHKKERRSHFSH